MSNEHSFAKKIVSVFNFLLDSFFRLPYKYTITFSLICHIYLAMTLGLSPDEAHYSLYAYHLDLSYYDHPPLVGWLQYPFLLVGKGQDWLMRLLPISCWLLTCWGIFKLAQLLFPERKEISDLSVLLFLLSPMYHLIGMALVPDSLLMPLTCLIIYLVTSIIKGNNKLVIWMFLGIALGLSGLGKYTSFVMGLSAIGCLLLFQGRQLLFNRGLWITIFIALALVSPVFIWNYYNGWISINYQLNHAQGQGSWELKHAVAYGIVQILTYGITVITLTVIGVLRIIKHLSVNKSFDTSNPAPKILLIFGIPLLILLLMSAGHSGALPHWSAPAWIALIPFSAWSFCEAKNAIQSNLPGPNTNKNWIVKFLGLATKWQIMICALIAVILAVGGIGRESGEEALSQMSEVENKTISNPIADLYGWDLASKHAVQLAKTQKIDNLAVMNWSLASRVAWYSRPMPVKVVNSHHDQFKLWFGDLVDGDSVILIDWSKMSFPKPDKKLEKEKFEQCRPIDQLSVNDSFGQISHFNFLICENWHS